MDYVERIEKKKARLSEYWSQFITQLKKVIEDFNREHPDSTPWTFEKCGASDDCWHVRIAFAAAPPRFGTVGASVIRGFELVRDANKTSGEIEIFTLLFPTWERRRPRSSYRVEVSEDGEPTVHLYRTNDDARKQLEMKDVVRKDLFGFLENWEKDLMSDLLKRVMG